MHRATGQRIFHAGQPDQRRLGGVGVEHVDTAVRDQHPSDSVGRQALQHVGNQVGRRPFRPPRRRDDLQARPNVVDARLVEHLHVGRAFGGEQRAGVHRRRIERIVVAGQQVHGNSDGAHGFQRLADDLRRQLVVFEDVTGYHDELGAYLCGQRAETGHCVAAGSRVLRLGFAGEEVTGHAELPVGSVHESHCGPVRCKWVIFSGHATCTPSRGCSAALGLRPFRASRPPAERGSVLRSAPRLTAAPTGPTTLSVSS